MPKPVEIVFQNSHFVAVNKPALCLSVRSRMGDKDSRPVLWDLLAEQLDRPVWAIHRLDFEVSGLMLWAVSKEGQSAGNTAFETNQVLKTYLALSENLKNLDPAQGWQEWKSKLLRGKKRAYESPHGKNALTRARCLGQIEKALKWELHPITGRSHQLRFELFKRDWPILGDQLYGSKGEFKSGIALQACSLKVTSKDLIKLGLPEELSLNNSSRLF